MTQDSQEATSFLLELYRMTGGDPVAKVSMFTVGEAIGLDKTDAGKMAETLIAQGWVEIKTLSGGIGITEEGLEAAHAAGASGGDAPGLTALGTQPVMDEQDHHTVSGLLNDIKAAIQESPAGYETLEALVMDVKSLEIHLLSPRAKTAVVREILRSIQDNLKDSLENRHPEGLAATIQQVLGNP
jgi:hypothetical protein